MWPFRKRPIPGAAFHVMQDFWNLTEQQKNALAGVGAGIKTYNDLKRRRREEKKMKLELNKWYEIEGFKGVYQCKVNSEGAFYFEGGDGSMAIVTYNSVVRESPAPLRLEVGKLYALSDGSVEWCHRDPVPGLYLVGAYIYYEDGAPGWMTPKAAPRILHRIKLNEPVSAGEFYMGVDPASDSGGRSALFWKHASGACDITRFAEKLQPGKRFDRCPACEAKALEKYTDNIRQAYCTVPALQGKPDPMRVEYKPHTDCDKREPVIPAGYEKINRSQSAPQLGDLYDECGVWVPPMMDGAFPFVPGGHTVIRPIAQPFRLSGPAWYRDVLGAWQNLTSCMYWYHSSGEWVYSCCETKIHYNSDGSNKSPRRGADLITRATDAQAKILEAL